jgi:hypothetical protein
MFQLGIFRNAQRFQRQLAELEEEYLKAVQENAVAWQEAARLGRVIATYDAKVKTRVDADTRLRAAEETARVANNRHAATDAFWTGLLNGEYDDGHIPAPMEPLADWEREALEEGEEEA